MNSANTKTSLNWLQVRQLVFLHLRMDFREGRASGKKRRLSRMGWNFIIYMAMGLSFAAQLIADASPSDFYFFMFSYSMAMCALSILLDFHSVLFLEEETDILGALPLSSKSIAVATLGHLLAYIFLLTTALMVFPTILVALSPGYSSVDALVLFASALWGNGLVAAVIVLIYQLCARMLGEERWQNAMTAVQMIFVLIVILLYLLIARGQAFSLVALQHRFGNWLNLLPATWFAGMLSFFQAGSGRLLYLVLPAVSSLVVIPASVILLSKSLLFPLASMSPKKKQKKEKQSVRKPQSLFSLLFKEPESKAGYTLASQLFKKDRQFRMAALPTMAMPVAVLLVAGWQGEIVDPFSGTVLSHSSFLGMFFFFLLFMSYSLATSITYSTDWQARWIFFVAPMAAPERFMRGIKCMMMIRFYVPLFCLLVAVLWFYLPPHHAWMHGLTLFQTSLVVFSFFSGRLSVYPFSQKRVRGDRARVWGVLIILASLGGGMMALQTLLYPLPMGWLLMNGILLLLLLGLEFTFSKRITKKIRKSIESYQIF